MLLSNNPKVFYEYEILEKYVAGIVLLGHEVKSIKQGKVNIKGCYVKVIKNELYIIGMNISKYMGYGEELRDRKLLVKRREIKNMQKAVEQKRLTIVPIKVFLKNGLVKLEIAVAKGKKDYDKKRDLKIKAELKDRDDYIKKISRN
jgi:SsrA-binding protein